MSLKLNAASEEPEEETATANSVQHPTGSPNRDTLGDQEEGLKAKLLTTGAPHGDMLNWYVL